MEINFFDDMNFEFVPVKFNAEQLKKLFRAEIKVSDHPEYKALGENQIAECGSDANITVTFEDLVVAISNLEDYSAEDFCYEWISPIENAFDENLGIEKLCGHGKDVNCITEEEKMASEILDNLAAFFHDMNENEMEPGEDDELKYKALLSEQSTIIDYYNYNKDKLPKDWKLTDAQKVKYLMLHDIGAVMNQFSNEEKELFKLYLEEMCEKGNLAALRIKAYAYYGDENPLYPCDWNISKDCLLKILDQGDDLNQAIAANTLGYIYYYGRCNNGKPQYDEAYKYFSLAAFFGMHEATYKIGDMLIAGKGTPKNRTAALKLYQSVYQDTKGDFASGNLSSKFADAALRLAGFYESGPEMDLLQSYVYYLEAQYAITCRQEDEYYYGDSVVAKRVKEGCQRVKEKLINDEVLDEEDTDSYVNIVSLMRLLTEDNYKLAVKLKKEKGGYVLTLIRYSDDEDDENVTPVLCVFPELSLARHITEIEIYIPADFVIDANECKSKTKVGWLDFNIDTGLEIHDMESNLILQIASPDGFVNEGYFYNICD